MIQVWEDLECINNVFGHICGHIIALIKYELQNSFDDGAF